MSQHDKNDFALENIHPPCQSACPLHQGVRDYLLAIATGDFDLALAIIKETNPLPFVCGTICAHHCEEECRRNDVDKPPSIRGLKRFAVEYGSAKVPPPADGPKIKGKVAIIGAGPAGLTAAFDLARLGADVTVFDREDSAGGAVRHYIPSYRLPDAAIDRDINEIAEQGITFKYGVELGKDITIAQLEKEGYQATILAMGLPISRGLNIPGAEGDGILYALPFLQDVKRKDYKFEGSPEVIVIGGGNVAMDVARTALRAGASKVKLTCLECDEEMPAFEWEIEEAREEGIEFNNSWGPQAIVRESGKVTGLEVVECTCVFDDKGLFNPTMNKDRQEVIKGDIVIFAIGQGGDSESVRGEIDVDDRGRLVFNNQKMTTSRPGVFSCGEVVTGPGSAVKAMANARLAAQAVSAHLQGAPFDAASLAEVPVLDKLDSKVAEEITHVSRNAIPMISPEERVRHFKQAELGYDVETAICEARRCLTCAAGAQQDEDLCVHCLTCVRICPYNVPVINEEGKVSVRNEQCQACGLCLSFCPVYAIKFRGSYVENAAAAIEPAVKKLVAQRNGKPAVLAITCSYGAFALPEFIKNDRKDLAVVRYPCVGKLDSAHLLKAIECGADKVVVVGCADSDKFTCQYKDVAPWSQKKVAHAAELLKMLGMDSECIKYTELAGEDISKFEQVVEEALKPKVEEEPKA
ncbi:MAG: FAD-dependent oxidoreductase [Dethiobacteria bacterium]|nr:FAD-dependent oxidoreductase [Dethiobacteria bacterium]